MGQFKVSSYALSVCLAISVSFPFNAGAQTQGGAQVRAEIKHDISPALRTLTSHHFGSGVPGGPLMFRLAYRRFGDGHKSIVATHSVNTPSGVRWYEIQDPGGTAWHNAPNSPQVVTFAGGGQ